MVSWMSEFNREPHLSSNFVRKCHSSKPCFRLFCLNFKFDRPCLILDQNMILQILGWVCKGYKDEIWKRRGTKMQCVQHWWINCFQKWGPRLIQHCWLPDIAIALNLYENKFHSQFHGNGNNRSWYLYRKYEFGVWKPFLIPTAGCQIQLKDLATLQPCSAVSLSVANMKHMGHVTHMGRW